MGWEVSHEETTEGYHTRGPGAGLTLRVSFRAGRCHQKKTNSTKRFAVRRQQVASARKMLAPSKTLNTIFDIARWWCPERRACVRVVMDNSTPTWSGVVTPTTASHSRISCRVVSRRSSEVTPHVAMPRWRKFRVRTLARFSGPGGPGTAAIANHRRRAC